MQSDCFAPFYDDRGVKMIGCEPGGTGSQIGQHAAPLSYGTPAVLHGFRCYTILDELGQSSSDQIYCCRIRLSRCRTRAQFLSSECRAQYVTSE